MSDYIAAVAERDALAAAVERVRRLCEDAGGHDLRLPVLSPARVLDALDGGAS